MTTNVDILSSPQIEPAPRHPPVPAEAAERRHDPLLWRVLPATLAAALGVAYLIVQPRTVDLAASLFRSRLFGEAGFTIWNNTWYSGHPTWSYSVLVPPLAWLLSPALLAAVSAVVSAALFEPLARRHFGERAARWGALWFGAAAATPMLSGRVTFAAGAAGALASLLALQRGRVAIGCVLALIAGLLSPIAGLFLGLAAFAYALTVDRRPGLLVTAAALAPPAVLSALFPDGGDAPFVFSAFWPVPLFALAFYAALPKRERTLRVAALLYAGAAVAAFLIPNPVGGNFVRLGALVAGPLLLMSRRRLGAPVIALLLVLAAWQWSAAVRDVAHSSGDPSTQASFYRPLNDFLTGAGGAPFRVEIPFTFSHWETAEVSPRFALARGWLRTDDVDYNHLFYGGRLDAATYRAWLSEHAVRFVAVPRAKPDYSARAELRLIAAGLPYLRPVWSARDWHVYEVTAPHSLGAVRLGVNDALVRFSAPGSTVVRVRWSPYWSAAGACVQKAGEWTRVTASRPGSFRLHQSFSLGRVFDRGQRCS
ncbi:MAG: hypothetical protein QOI19_864 [Thermoleophilaceae bacterium]|nr:hypothetical protein [Thermoleophilaceae bacterium]